MTDASLNAKRCITALAQDMMGKGLSFDDAVDAMSAVFDQLISAEGLGSPSISDRDGGSVLVTPRDNG